MAQEAKELKEVKESKIPKQQVSSKKNIGKFFREVKGELKKVVWPTRTQLINNTITVLIACIVVGLFIWGADLGYQKIYDLVFGAKN